MILAFSTKLLADNNCSLEREGEHLLVMRIKGQRRILWFLLEDFSCVEMTSGAGGHTHTHTQQLFFRPLGRKLVIMRMKGQRRISWFLLEDFSFVEMTSVGRGSGQDACVEMISGTKWENVARKK